MARRPCNFILRSLARPRGSLDSTRAKQPLGKYTIIIFYPTKRANSIPPMACKPAHDAMAPWGSDNNSDLAGVRVNSARGSFKPAHTTAAPWGADEHSSHSQPVVHDTAAYEPAQSCKPAHSKGTPWGVGESAGFDAPGSKYGARGEFEPTQSCKPAHKTESPWDDDGHVDGSFEAAPKYGGRGDTAPTQSFKPTHTTATPWGRDEMTTMPTSSRGGSYDNEAAQGSQLSARESARAIKAKAAGSGSLW